MYELMITEYRGDRRPALYPSIILKSSCYLHLHPPAYHNPRVYVCMRRVWKADASFFSYTGGKVSRVGNGGNSVDDTAGFRDFRFAFVVLALSSGWSLVGI